MKWGIASKFAVIFSLLVLVATATVGFMVYRGARQSLIKASMERVAHTSEIIDVRLSASIEAIDKDAQFLQETPPVRGIVRVRSLRPRGYLLDPQTALSDQEWRTQLAEIVESLLKNRPSYTQISFIEAANGTREILRVEKREGEIYHAPQRELQQLGQHIHVNEAMELPPGTLYLSEIEWDASVEAAPIPMLSAATPVYSNSGVPFGLILIRIDFREILTAFQALATPDKSLYIANEGGIFLLHPDSSQSANAVSGLNSSFQEAFNHPDLRRFLNGQDHQASIERIGEGPSRTLAHFERLYFDSGLDAHRHFLTLGITSPHETILENVMVVQNRSLFITLLYSLVGILLALVFSRFLTRPLSQITEALSHFDSDEWDKELPIQRRDEIGVLARAFDTMGDQIHHQLHALEEKEHHQRIILETAAEGIIVTNVEGEIEVFNGAAERIFGYQADEVTGKNIELLIPISDHGEETHPPYAVEPYQWKMFGSSREISGLRKEGGIITLSVAVSTFDISGETKFASFVQDITERKLYEEALEHAKEHAEEMARLKSAFLANMSHEIRTPLTSVIGYASILAKEASGKHRRFAHLIESSGRRLMDTLNAVLALAQLESSRMEVQLEETNIAKEASEVMQLFESLARQKKLALTFEASPEAQNARAALNRGAISSILQNLIGNAIKFTDEGYVAVRVDTDEKNVYICVKDTGVGIDPAFFPYLFDEFRQESTGLNRTHEGSGLGLAITRRLIELMHGEIHVESEKNKGSTFTMSFPRFKAKRASAAATADIASHQTISNGSRSKLLVVEDNTDTVHLIQHILEDVCQISVASTADEALEQASQTTYDAVLMDINLGSGPNGIDVLHELRTRHPYQDVPIIAVTAYALPGDHDRFIQEGFDTYLSKPFSAQKLRTLTKDLLQRPKLG